MSICQLRKHQQTMRPAQMKQGVPRATFLKPLKPEKLLGFRVPTSHLSRAAKEI